MYILSLGYFVFSSPTNWTVIGSSLKPSATFYTLSSSIVLSWSRLPFGFLNLSVLLLILYECNFQDRRLTKNVKILTIKKCQYHSENLGSF